MTSLGSSCDTPARAVPTKADGDSPPLLLPVSLPAREILESDLAGAIPTVPEWRLAEVPKYLEPEEVERVVLSCRQRDTAIARRDHAIVLLLARLGLRASERLPGTL